jgi:hypothetical protein
MTLDIFKKTGMFTASSLVVSQASWNKGEDKSKGSKNTHKLDYQIILPEHTWRRITSHCVDLSEQAQVISGAIIGQKHENKRWTTYEDPKPVGFLTGVKKVMKRPFFIDYSEATTIIYPNSLEEPRKDKEEILSGTKVLMVSDPDSTWGRRVRVAIERKDHYVSNSFWIIVPTSNAQSLSITHEVLAAILNWDVSNAWIIEYLKYPWIPVRAIKTIPFPSSLSKDDCCALTEAVWKLEEAAQVNQPPPKEVNQKIDNILKAAYHLDNVTFERLRKVMEWDIKPQITLDPEVNNEKANWFLSGIVDNVNAEQGTITLWLEGFHELQTVQITPSMPGWMLRPSAAFRTKIPDGYVDEGKIDPDTTDWGTFRPQPYTYMSEEELLEELSNLLQEDDKNRIG